jgi:hypothetical protein
MKVIQFKVFYIFQDLLFVHSRTVVGQLITFLLVFLAELNIITETEI